MRTSKPKGILLKTQIRTKTSYSIYENIVNRYTDNNKKYKYIFIYVYMYISNDPSCKYHICVFRNTLILLKNTSR